LPLSRGEHRADVVCVNGVLAGYEIKSDGDSLVRLPRQAQGYATVFEYMTVVIAPRHLVGVRRVVPKGCGIIVFDTSPTGLVFRQVRQPRRNGRLDRQTLCRLLWKDECIRALRAHGVRVDRNALVVDIWPMLEALPTQVLCAHVRDALKARGVAGSGQPQTPSGDSRTTATIG